MPDPPTVAATYVHSPPQHNSHQGRPSRPCNLFSMRRYQMPMGPRAPPSRHPTSSSRNNLPHSLKNTSRRRQRAPRRHRHHNLTRMIRKRNKRPPPARNQRRHRRRRFTNSRRNRSPPQRSTPRYRASRNNNGHSPVRRQVRRLTRSKSLAHSPHSSTVNPIKSPKSHRCHSDSRVHLKPRRRPRRRQSRHRTARTRRIQSHPSPVNHRTVNRNIRPPTTDTTTITIQQSPELQKK